MNNLTVLEILKRITLINLQADFPDAKNIEFDDTQNCFWVESVGFTSWPLLNPLIDDALCFQLMVKYHVEIEFDSDLNFVCAINDSWVNNESPNKAILLVIIEAHKES